MLVEWAKTHVPESFTIERNREYFHRLRELKGEYLSGEKKRPTRQYLSTATSAWPNGYVTESNSANVGTKPLLTILFVS
jgi:hypothetical protein